MLTMALSDQQLEIVDSTEPLITDQVQTQPDPDSDPDRVMREALFPINRLETRMEKLVSSELDGR